MLGKLGELNEGYNVLTEMNGQCSDMSMDIGIYKMSNGKEELLFGNKNETAVLLLEGAIRLEWEGMEQVIQRQSVFEENPWC
ncbi:5-deoxy-glucuronate isomerase, partial [Bacillus toyonensis]|uniref:5-deoxy-glucuronate isomerase n=1 Tax=Bacillus toyonensis TaxID=155322 RepID=UPI0035DD3BB2